MTIGRRQFCALLGLSAFAPASLACASQSRAGFLDESGKRGEWPLVVGLLMTRDPGRHDGAIAALRRRYGYPRLLRYTSTDCRKADFAAAVVDYWATADDLSFTAVLADDSRDRWRSASSCKDEIYAGIYRRLLILADIDLDLHLKFRRENERDRRLRSFIAGDLGLVPTIDRDDSVPSNLTQLAGFLAGCVYGEATRTGHPVKATLVEHVRQGVGSPALATAATPRFRVTRTTV